MKEKSRRNDSSKEKEDDLEKSKEELNKTKRSRLDELTSRYLELEEIPQPRRRISYYDGVYPPNKIDVFKTIR